MKTDNAQAKTEKGYNANLHRQGGFALLSMGLALLVAVAIIGGLIASYFAITGTIASGDARANIATMAGNIKSNLGRQSSGGYQVLSSNGAQLLIRLDAIPSELVISSNTVRNEFGGRYSFGTANSNQEFVITTTNVPESDCLRLTGNGMSDWTDIRVGNTSVDGSASAAATQCSSGGNTLEFQSY